MAANTDPIFSLTPHNAGAQFTSADTTSTKTLVAAASLGSGMRIDNLPCSTSDTAAVDLGFYLQVGGAGADLYLGNVHLPAGSGYLTVPGVNAIAALPLANTGSLELAAGDVLKVACAATMTAGKQTDVVALGGDY